MRKMSIREMRAELGRLREVLEQDGEVVVTRNGQPIARVVPLGAKRRRRAHDDLRAFEEDLANGDLFVHTVGDEALDAALPLIDRLADRPLRTLDALHLALARQLAAPRLATADERMAEAARAAFQPSWRATATSRLTAREWSSGR